MDVGDEGRCQLLRRLAEPSLWDGFVLTLESVDLPAQTSGERAKSLALVAQQRRSDLYRDIWETAELLIAHDQAWASWRARHALLVERQLGHKPGTGGTGGVRYLRSRLAARFFPELWELRTEL
jgi:tryptophan 2,3-dioxygenase